MKKSVKIIAGVGVLVVVVLVVFWSYSGGGKGIIRIYDSSETTSDEVMVKPLGVVVDGIKGNCEGRLLAKFDRISSMSEVSGTWMRPEEGSIDLVELEEMLKRGCSVSLVLESLDEEGPVVQFEPVFFTKRYSNVTREPEDAARLEFSTGDILTSFMGESYSVAHEEGKVVLSLIYGISGDYNPDYFYLTLKVPGGGSVDGYFSHLERFDRFVIYVHN